MTVSIGAAAFCAAAFAHSVQYPPPGFVRLSEAAPGIAQDLRYAARNNVLGRALAGYDTGACILRVRTAEALAKAQAALEPLGYGLLAFDCYRPKRAVRDLVRYAETAPRPATPYHPAVSGPGLLAQGYIARQSGHSTGLSVDVTLIHLDSRQRQSKPPACGGPRADQEADMGTGFDCFDPRAGHGAKISPEQAKRRAILHDAMIAAGFTPYAAEWWHFSLPPRSAAERQAFDFSVR